MSKYAIVTTLMVLMLLVACDRYLDSQDPVRSLPTSISIPINLEAVVDDSTITLSWELTDSSEAALFRVYASESEEGEYLLRDSTTEFSITLCGLLLNRPAFLKVTTVTASGVESQASAEVSATPAHFSININDNNEFANQRDVQVRFITGVSALYVQISEQQDFGDAVWESFGVSKWFELSEDDGVKTVYARLQFADGSETGQPLSDDITLDTYAEIDTFWFYIDSTLPVGGVTTFRMQTGEVGGEASCSFGTERNLELFDDGTHGDLVADDAMYTLEYTVPFDAYAFDEVVTGSFTDEAGNDAEFTAERLMNINMPPDSVTLAADFQGDTVVFTWTTSTADDFASYRLYKKSDSGVDTDSDLIAIFTSVGVTEYRTISSGGTWYYKLFVFDRHGAAKGSNVESGP